MTTIAVKRYADRTEIACDSRMTSDHSVCNFINNDKLLLHENTLFGIAGDASFAGDIEYIIRSNLDTPVEDKDDVYMLVNDIYNLLKDLPRLDNIDSNPVCMLIILKNGLPFYVCDRFVAEIKNTYAIGSGCEYAIGYLEHDNATVYDAVKTAAKYDIFTDDNIVLYTVKNDTITKHGDENE